MPKSHLWKKGVNPSICKTDVLLGGMPDPPQEAPSTADWPKMENTTKEYLTHRFRELADQWFWDESTV